MSNVETALATLSIESGYLNFDNLSYVMKIFYQSLFFVSHEKGLFMLVSLIHRYE